MPDLETLLAEAFGFEKFVHVEELQREIDRTLDKYEDGTVLFGDDLDAIAGGFYVTPPDDEGGRKL